MRPFQVPQDSRHPQEEDMSPGNGRKKPICQKCDFPMEGHKRPFGSPVCPTHESTPSRSVSPKLDGSPSPAHRKRKNYNADFTFNPTSFGGWHRENPYWVDPDSQSRQPRHREDIPRRSEIEGSWISTEPDNASRASPTRRRAIPTPAARASGSEVIDVDEEEDAEGETGEHEETSDTQSNISHSSSQTILQRVGRGLSFAIGRSRPLASLYSSPGEEVTDITSAAKAEGLYTRVVHLGRPRRVKTEPVTPPRTTPTRDHSWWVAVGRDQHAVDALADSYTPPKRRVRAGSEPPLDPYDYDRGLSSERNERVGAYPHDPRLLRNSYLDLMVAGAMGGFAIFFCLSLL